MAANISRTKARSKKTRSTSDSVPSTLYNCQAIKHHKARCERLLKLSDLRPQDINLLWVMKHQNYPSNSALAQLAAIELRMHRYGRICRYCGGDAELISEFAYQCDQCGGYLNLDWVGGEGDA